MNLWSSIQYVGTGLSLVAFAIAAAMLAYRARLQQRAAIIRSAPQEERLAAISATAEAFHVDVSGLSERHRQEIVMAQIKMRARRELLFAASALTVALLLSATAVVAIILTSQENAVKQSSPTLAPEASKPSEPVRPAPTVTADPNEIAKRRGDLPSELDDDLTIGASDKDLELRNKVILTRGHRLTILAKDLTSLGGVIMDGIPASLPAPSGATGRDGAYGQRGSPGGNGMPGANGSDAKEIKIIAQTFDGDLYINNSGGPGQDGGRGGRGGNGGASIQGQPSCLNSPEARGGGGGEGGSGVLKGAGGAGGSGGSAFSRGSGGGGGGGGVGANVGLGGAGGDGGSAFDIGPWRSDGAVGGDGGGGGNGGDGGHGGLVTLIFNTVKADSVIRVHSRPGNGGSGGAGGDAGGRGPGNPCISVGNVVGPPVSGGSGGGGGASFRPGNIQLYISNGGNSQSAVGSLEFP